MKDEIFCGLCQKHRPASRFSEKVLQNLHKRIPNVRLRCLDCTIPQNTTETCAVCDKLKLLSQFSTNQRKSDRPSCRDCVKLRLDEVIVNNLDEDDDSDDDFYNVTVKEESSVSSVQIISEHCQNNRDGRDRGRNLVDNVKREKIDYISRSRSPPTNSNRVRDNYRSSSDRDSSQGYQSSRDNTLRTYKSSSRDHSSRDNIYRSSMDTSLRGNLQLNQSSRDIYQSGRDNSSSNNLRSYQSSRDTKYSHKNTHYSQIPQTTQNHIFKAPTTNIQTRYPTISNNHPSNKKKSSGDSKFPNADFGGSIASTEHNFQQKPKSILKNRSIGDSEFPNADFGGSIASTEYNFQNPKSIFLTNRLIGDNEFPQAGFGGSEAGSSIFNFKTNKKLTANSEIEFPMAGFGGSVAGSSVYGNGTGKVEDHDEDDDDEDEFPMAGFGGSDGESD